MRIYHICEEIGQVSIDLAQKVESLIVLEDETNSLNYNCDFIHACPFFHDPE